MVKKAILIIVIFLFIFSSFALARDLDEILKSGYIIFGIRKISITIYQGREYTNPGFCYEIAEAFAQDLGVRPKLYIVSKFSDYWMKNGIFLLKTKPLRVEPPDIYNKVDVASDIITLTKERQKLVNMVPFIENTEIFFGRRDLDVKNYADLRGLRVITYEGMSFYNLIKQELEERGIPYVVNYINIDDTEKISYAAERKSVSKDMIELLVVPSNKKVKKFFAYYQILLGHADVSLHDSFSFFLNYYKTLSFRDGLKPLFPARKKIGYLSFCTSYNTQRLNKRLERFMENFRKTDKFNSLVKRYMGISYEEYKSLLYGGE